MAAVIASAWTLLSEAVFGEPRRTVPFEVTGPEHGVIPIEAVEIPHFPAGDPAAYDYLEENGYVVISGVLDDEEVEHAKGLFWDFLEDLESDNLAIKRDDPETWDPWPGLSKKGIINSFGMGQSEFMWYVRTRRAVIDAFAGVWEADAAEMLTSFDGGNMFRPWHAPGREAWKTAGGWCHVDQSGSGRQCVQGLVTLLPASHETGGLVVIPGSQDDHDDLLARTGVEPERDYIRLQLDDPILTADGVKGRLVSAPAGSLLLWDSRCVHCNTPALSRPHSPPDEPLRMVAYICMTPRHLAPPDVLASRKMAYTKRQSTSHWPHKFFAFDDAYLGRNKLPLTPTIMRLIGYTEAEIGRAVEAGEVDPEVAAQRGPQRVLALWR